ncbi:MAG: ATP-binding protein [Glaciecola sp.]
MPAEYLQTSYERNTVVSSELYTLQNEQPALFQNVLTLFSDTTGANNAFLYLLHQRKYFHVGTASREQHANWRALSEYLANTPGHGFEVIDAPVENIYTPDQFSLVAKLLLDDELRPLAILGSYLDIDKTVNATTRTAMGLVARQITTDLTLRNKILVMQAQQAHHEKISELNQDYICVKDTRHRLVYANQALLQTFPSGARTKVVGNTDAAFYEPEMSAQIIESDLMTLELGVHEHNQLLTLPNGEQKILDTTKKTFTGSNGNTYIMSVSRDVTEKEILINDLKRSNGDLDNFAYVASHDLKSPLNVIKRLVTWVNEDCKAILPQDSQENLELVLNRVERMEKLLVDLLSYSRIGKDYQESIEVNVKQVVVELLSLIDLPMGFVVNCDDIDISVPPVAFNVVMLNLINNAIKHHDSGNAKIEIKVKRNNKGAIVSVCDNGPGIALKDRSKIFQLFETLRPRDEVEGSGMGLSVVKKVVEHYGGYISVEDNIPRGVKFNVNWPITNIARSVLSNINN